VKIWQTSNLQRLRFGEEKRKIEEEETRMWANAQRDGRPAEYRWRPLFNAAKFGSCPLLECCAVTLPRRETRCNLQGCPKLVNQQISAASRPKFTILWRHVEEILLLNKFFYSAKKLKLRRVLQTLWGAFERCSRVRL